MTVQIIIDSFIDYLFTIKRYSEKTVKAYSDVLCRFADYCEAENKDDFLSSITVSFIRSYENDLLQKSYSPKTVNQHLSILSSFSKFLIKEKYIEHNPIPSIHRPKLDKDLPVFYKSEALKSYMDATQVYADEEAFDYLKSCNEQGSKKDIKLAYERRLKRLIILLLYTTGIRRSELISIQLQSVDFSRKTLRVRGKGDKIREIPILDDVLYEISLYLQVVDYLGLRSSEQNLLLTYSGSALYPMFVDRAVKSEFANIKDIRGRKSPHVLRHTLATELLNKGTDLNSIKEMLGHSSLAATQVYTHNSIEKLKSAYLKAHPRAKKTTKEL